MKGLFGRVVIIEGYKIKEQELDILREGDYSMLVGITGLNNWSRSILLFIEIVLVEEKDRSLRSLQFEA